MHTMYYTKTAHHRISRGFGLLEILVSSAIISASLVALVAVIQLSFNATEEALLKTQAEFLAEEGLEAVRILRDESWSTRIAPLANGTLYYPVFASSTSTWSLSGSDPGFLHNRFTRTIHFAAVCRKNADDDIIACSSADPHYTDAGTKEVTSRLTWGNSEKEVVFRGYITDLFSN